jgi:PAS domain S-box-containing protein
VSAGQANDSGGNLSAATLRWLNDHAAEGIFTTDSELRICSWNHWLQAATGIAPSAAVGQSLFDIVPTIPARRFDRYYSAALAGEVKVLSHALHRYILPSTQAASGQQMPQSGRIAPLIERGTVVGTITVIHDVSERVAAERVLRAQIEAAESARHTAEEASRVKDEFLATLSHEIRTPLNAVLGWTRILRSREPDPAMLARAIDVIDRNATAQLTLVTDMLDMARITAGKVRLEVTEVDIAVILMAAVDVVRPAAAAKQIAISMAVEPDAPIVSGDGDRLLQVFWNVLSNAVKFTEAGGRISVRVDASDSLVRVAITDTGVGIAPDFLPQIFQRFKQADPSAARRHGGLGLGLALVREIVHMHGGSVVAESAGAHAGTTFTVVLPAVERTPALRAAVAPPRPLLRGVQILIVEDDPDAREIVSTAVIDAGAFVHAAATVHEALDILRADGVPPQVVVADIGLPEADGYALIRALRTLPADHGGAAPVIAVTAYATAEDRRSALDAGFYAHITKPFVPDELVATIARALQPAAST